MRRTAIIAALLALLTISAGTAEAYSISTASSSAASDGLNQVVAAVMQVGNILVRAFNTQGIIQWLDASLYGAAGFHIIWLAGEMRNLYTVGAEWLLAKAGY